MYGDVSDEILAARVTARDVDAFGRLYDRFAPHLHAWAAHVLGTDAADDAVQEIFLRVWRNARQFDPGRARFATWLNAIARHHIGAAAARRGRERVVAAADAIDALFEATDVDDVETTALARDAERRLAAALATLPPEQRRVLVLSYFFAMSQSEIARALALPLGTVKKRVRLGMQKLRHALVDERTTTPRLRVLVDE